MRFDVLIGGKAGQGPNVITHILGEALVSQGYHVFYSRDYQSLIRGGHNFNVLSFSDKAVYSNESKIDILVCLDEKTCEIHEKELKKNGIVLKGEHDNIYFVGNLFKIFGIDFEILKESLRKLKNFEENLKHAKQGYDTENRNLFSVSKNSKKPAEFLDEENRGIEIPKSDNEKAFFMNGSQGIADGAINSGLDVYYGYPMTPATPVMMELGSKELENNFLVLELENEIAVINAALGSAMTGAKSMVGTSGGGFDLMTEALSLSGQAEIPVVIYLATRPGPSTGAATYTSQGDLNLALHSGHGEFPRVVIAPGDVVECQELVSQAFYFSQKYKIPAIVLSDKHLAESFYTFHEKARITKSEKITELKRYNSYEHTETGEATEDAGIIKKNVEARLKKAKEIRKEAVKFDMYKIFGNEKSKNLIVGWGSVKGAILDALPDNCKFLQILYLEPFPDIKKELEKAEKIILVENNSTCQLGRLIAEKCLMEIKKKNKILRYDGRPFLADELKNEISRRLGK